MIGAEAVLSLYRQRSPRSWRHPRSWWLTVYVVCEHSTVFGHTRIWLHSRRRDARLVFDTVTLLPIPRLGDLHFFRRDLKRGES